MTTPIAGLHHVTAICADAQKNRDFYCDVLGLRLVKRTVNFDDPGSYHSYYGDQSGAPSTILTFFVWPNAQRGKVGSGETSAIALSVPRDAVDFWRARLAQHKISIESTRFGDAILALRDPDGILLELTFCNDARSGWNNGEIEIEYLIRGIHSVTIIVTSASHDVETLRGIMGFKLLEKEGERWRMTTNQEKNAGAGPLIDVVQWPETRALQCVSSDALQPFFACPERQRRIKATRTALMLRVCCSAFFVTHYTT